MNSIENEKASISKEKQEKATLKNKKREAVPAFKINKNNGIYTITMNYYNDDGRLDMTEEPVVFKLAEHTNNMEGISSISNFNIEFVTPGAIHALREKKTRTG